jgi:hypothetical protein
MKPCLLDELPLMIDMAYEMKVEREKRLVRTS